MKQLVIGILVLVISFATTGQARGQEVETCQTQTCDTKAGLKLSIKLDKESYHLKETARLKVTLQNVGHSQITLFKKMGWGASASLSLAILDERNNPLPPTFIDDAFRFRSFSKEDFASIMPDESLQKERGVNLQQYGIVKPGKYQIVVWYNSPVSKRNAPSGLDIWSSENGMLMSKSISFNVIE
jgi:hypothetical protein